MHKVNLVPFYLVIDSSKSEIFSAGIRHIIEHTIFKKEINSVKLSEYLDNCFSSYNAYTSSDVMTFIFYIEDHKYSEIKKNILNFIKEGQISENSFLVEKQIVGREIFERKSEERSVLINYLGRISSRAWNFDFLGDYEDLEELTYNDFLNLLDKFDKNSNILLEEEFDTYFRKRNEKNDFDLLDLGSEYQIKNIKITNINHYTYCRLFKEILVRLRGISSDIVLSNDMSLFIVSDFEPIVKYELLESEFEKIKKRLLVAICKSIISNEHVPLEIELQSTFNVEEPLLILIGQVYNIKYVDFFDWMLLLENDGKKIDYSVNGARDLLKRFNYSIIYRKCENIDTEIASHKLFYLCNYFFTDLFVSYSKFYGVNYYGIRVYGFFDSSDLSFLFDKKFISSKLKKEHFDLIDLKSLERIEVERKIQEFEVSSLENFYSENNLSRSNVDLPASKILEDISIQDYRCLSSERNENIEESFSRSFNCKEFKLYKQENADTSFNILICSLYMGDELTSIELMSISNFLVSRRNPVMKFLRENKSLCYGLSFNVRRVSNGFLCLTRFSTDHDSLSILNDELGKDLFHIDKADLIYSTKSDMISLMDQVFFLNIL